MKLIIWTKRKSISEWHVSSVNEILVLYLYLRWSQDIFRNLKCIQQLYCNPKNILPVSVGNLLINYNDFRWRNVSCGQNGEHVKVVWFGARLEQEKEGKLSYLTTTETKHTWNHRGRRRTDEIPRPVSKTKQKPEMFIQQWCRHVYKNIKKRPGT